MVYRYDQLMHESRALNTALQKYRTQFSAHERQKTEREELLGKQFTANDNSVSAIHMISSTTFFLLKRMGSNAATYAYSDSTNFK